MKIEEMLISKQFYSQNLVLRKPQKKNIFDCRCGFGQKKTVEIHLDIAGFILSL